MAADVSARFFFSYQSENSVWAELTPETSLQIFQHDVEGSSPGLLQPFPVMLSSTIAKQTSRGLRICPELIPLHDPVESAPASELKEVSFALLDFPLMGDVLREPRPSIPILSCGEFDVIVTKPTDKHRAVSNVLGQTPHILSDSVTIRKRSGQTFDSDDAKQVLETVHYAFSFVAGRWVGMTLVEGTNDAGERKWFQWGTGRMSEKSRANSWYDPRYPQWLTSLCDVFHELRKREEVWEPINSALYWYHRSNARGGAGIDSSLILSQCALELLSWLVIVKKTGALSEEGYGQLNSAAEKLRLALTLLSIPRGIPVGLRKLTALAKEMKWRDVADAVVQGRNYLVHPTQSRSGKRRPKGEFDWYELWVAAQWLLELVFLRLFGYVGSYHNRTHLQDIERVEHVPWT